jgi:hypothetical protein
MFSYTFETSNLFQYDIVHIFLAIDKDIETKPNEVFLYKQTNIIIVSFIGFRKLDVTIV